MRRICTLLGLLVVGLLTGCSSGAEPVDNPAPASEPEVTAAPPAPEMISITGAVALGGGAVIHDLPEPGQCTAHSEYTDIKPGVQVVVRDSAGSVVATTELGDGARYGDSEDCVWPFDVDVPAGGGFYSAELLTWESDVVAEADLSTTIVAILPAG